MATTYSEGDVTFNGQPLGKVQVAATQDTYESAKPISANFAASIVLTNPQAYWHCWWWLKYLAGEQSLN